MRSLLVVSVLLALCGAWLLTGLSGRAMAADETVCIQCHGGMPGALGAPTKEWPGSVHQRNGISCHDCHGGDPTDFAMAMSPERGFVGAPEYADVPAFCGRCHIGVLEDYLESAHGRAVADGGAQCVICHGNHAVQEAQIDLINEQDCSRCHEYGRAAEIKTALLKTDTALSQTDAELQRLHRLGFAVDPLKGQLFALRNSFHRVFHSVEVERVNAKTGEVQAKLAEIDAHVDEVDARLGQRKLWGGGVVGLLVLMGMIFLHLRKTYHDEE